MAHEGGVDRELEEPVGVIDLERPLGRNRGPDCVVLHQRRPAAQRELAGGVGIVVGMKGAATVRLEIHELGRAKDEGLEATVHDPHGDRVHSRRHVGASHGREHRLALPGPIEQVSPLSCEVGGGGGEMGPGHGVPVVEWLIAEFY